MSGRALVFSNPKVIDVLKKSFVSYAGDQWYLHRQQDEDGRFFWNVAQEGHSKDAPKNSTRQGVYVATPEGKFLRSDHFHPSPERMLALLNDSLRQWEKEPKRGATVVSTAADERFQRKPPAGGLILNTFTRIPQKRTIGTKWTANHATARDHMWITREEANSLLPAEWRKGARYPLPKAVAERLVRFHLTDNVRGEPPMWRRDEIHNADLYLTVADAAGRLKLEGSAQLRHGDDRGYDARLQGDLVYDRKGGRFTRFDLLSWGEAWGEGTYTRGAPEGRFPLVVAFTLAGNAPADQVPPQASRDLHEYFGTGRASR